MKNARELGLAGVLALSIGMTGLGCGDDGRLGTTVRGNVRSVNGEVVALQQEATPEPTGSFFARLRRWMVPSSANAQGACGAEAVSACVVTEGNRICSRVKPATCGFQLIYPSKDGDLFSLSFDSSSEQISDFETETGESLFEACSGDVFVVTVDIDFASGTSVGTIDKSVDACPNAPPPTTNTPDPNATATPTVDPLATATPTMGSGPTATPTTPPTATPTSEPGSCSAQNTEPCSSVTDCCDSMAGCGVKSDNPGVSVCCLPQGSDCAGRVDDCCNACVSLAVGVATCT